MYRTFERRGIFASQIKFTPNCCRRTYSIQVARSSRLAEGSRGRKRVRNYVTFVGMKMYIRWKFQARMRCANKTVQTEVVL